MEYLAGRQFFAGAVGTVGRCVDPSTVVSAFTLAAHDLQIKIGECTIRELDIDQHVVVCICAEGYNTGFDLFTSTVCQP